MKAPCCRTPLCRRPPAHRRACRGAAAQDPRKTPDTGGQPGNRPPPFSATRRGWSLHLLSDGYAWSEAELAVEALQAARARPDRGVARHYQDATRADHPGARHEPDAVKRKHQTDRPPRGERPPSASPQPEAARHPPAADARTDSCRYVWRHSAAPCGAGWPCNRTAEKR